MKERIFMLAVLIVGPIGLWYLTDTLLEKSRDWNLLFNVAGNRHNMSGSGGDGSASYSSASAEPSSEPAEYTGAARYSNGPSVNDIVRPGGRGAGNSNSLSTSSVTSSGRLNPDAGGIQSISLGDATNGMGFDRGGKSKTNFNDTESDIVSTGDGNVSDVVSTKAGNTSNVASGRVGNTSDVASTGINNTTKVQHDEATMRALATLAALRQKSTNENNSDYSIAALAGREPGVTAEARITRETKTASKVRSEDYLVTRKQQPVKALDVAFVLMPDQQCDLLVDRMVATSILFRAKSTTIRGLSLVDMDTLVDLYEECGGGKLVVVQRDEGILDASKSIIRRRLEEVKYYLLQKQIPKYDLIVPDNL